jgi:hypothetical protein
MEEVMNRIEDRDDDIVELGVASVVTQGPIGGKQDGVSGLDPQGLTND